MAARALIDQPEMLLLDEFSLRIENQNTHHFMDALWENLPGTTVLAVVNDMYNLFKYDRIMVLDKGQVVEFASPKDLL